MAITEDQTAVIEFLASPSTRGEAPVERIETHHAPCCGANLTLMVHPLTRRRASIRCARGVCGN